LDEKRLVLSIVFTLVFIACLLPFVLRFQFESEVGYACIPPQGKVVKVGIYCQETETPVPDGLNVTLTKGFLNETQVTVDGWVTFGDGTVGNWVIAGDYNISFYWNQPFKYQISIDCTKPCWQFKYYVPNPVIIKHVETKCECESTPVEGLEFSLYENGVKISTKETDASGTVVFGGDLVEVCKEYVLKYTWLGTEYTEPDPPVHFKYVNGELLVCQWELTNIFATPKVVESG